MGQTLRLAGISQGYTELGFLEGVVGRINGYIQTRWK